MGATLVAERLLDQLRAARHLAWWVVLGAASGALAGVGSFLLLESLARATEVRVEHGWLLFLLPAAGVAIGLVHHHVGGDAVRGSALLLDEIHEPTRWLPQRMGPLVFGGAVVSHVFGASVGREGTAVQVAGSLSDGLARLLRLAPADRRLLLVAALAGGFGSAFGVPLAGAVFALEVQSIGRIRYEALVPALAASITGDLVVRGLGHEHEAHRLLDLPHDALGLGKVAVAGVAFGLVATLFAGASHRLAALTMRAFGHPALRLLLGGAATVGLAVVFGRQYLGLSVPLAEQALAGVDPGADFALKLLFTVVALGTGFPGGEVTPLFVIGATLGGALAGPLGLGTAELAGVGYVAVFAGAANTPLACTVMAAELFGGGAVLAAAVGCVTAYVCSGHHGIYGVRALGVEKRRLPESG